MSIKLEHYIGANGPVDKLNKIYTDLGFSPQGLREIASEEINRYHVGLDRGSGLSEFTIKSLCSQNDIEQMLGDIFAGGRFELWKSPVKDWGSFIVGQLNPQSPEYVLAEV